MQGSASLVEHGEQVAALLRVAEGLALVARELHAVVPLARLGDAASDELDHDVHGLAVGDIAGEEGAYTVAIGNLALAVAVQLEGAVDVEAVAEDGLLGHGVDAELLVFVDDEVDLLLLHSTVDAQAAEGHGHALGEVAEEDVVAEAVVEEDSYVAIIHLGPLVHDIVVALEHAAHNLLEADALVRHGAQAGDALLHGEVDVGGAGEAATLAVGGLLDLGIGVDEGIDDALLVGKREAAARAHVAQGESALPYAAALLEGLLILGFAIVLRGIAIEHVHELGNGGEDGHLPHDGGPPLALDAYVEMSLGILGDGELGRVEAVAAQEHIDKPIGKEGEAAGHERALLIGDGHFGQVMQLLAEQAVEPCGVACGVAIEELILGLGTRILLQDIVHAGEGVEVVVGEVIDDGFHGLFMVIDMFVPPRHFVVPDLFFFKVTKNCLIRKAQLTKGCAFGEIAGVF